ncbi:hypothetical protein CKAN_01894800 [Cinnamomum micranthum f. kanehirae]|uniref:Uncharacterized protein n=1 Tax=Cinnamomum micranthum f. kanehirae TaxID=337451 RepID=A0A3S3NL77_9MAGN|nr:hypothetical protein CKAN_01894800 [Cinnamomum micranthum f. kanehirae]
MSSGVAMATNRMAFSVPNVSYAHVLILRINFTAAIPLFEIKILWIGVFPPRALQKSPTSNNAAGGLIWTLPFMDPFPRQTPAIADPLQDSDILHGSNKYNQT